MLDWPTGGLNSAGWRADSAGTPVVGLLRQPVDQPAEAKLDACTHLAPTPSYRHITGGTILARRAVRPHRPAKTVGRRPRSCAVRKPMTCAFERCTSELERACRRWAATTRCCWKRNPRSSPNCIFWRKTLKRGRLTRRRRAKAHGRARVLHPALLVARIRRAPPKNGCPPMTRRVT